MIWNDHSKIKEEGAHAFLSASKYHWLNYNPDKLIESYRNSQAAEQGTADHAFAALCIQRRQRLPKSAKTLNMYVNDAIGFRMDPEVVLYFSEFCFGTADAIAFRKKFLRIHDLKTGVTPAHMEQLYIYAALFCLEYHKKPAELEGIELRIYQSNDIFVEVPSPDLITHVMDQIIYDNKILEGLDQEGD